MRFVDMNADPRRAQFELFRHARVPYAGITAECDITHFLKTVRENGLPFFLTMLYCAINAANEVPELRRRILPDGRVVEYERCISSHTVALPDGTYTYCSLDCAKPFAEYLPYARVEVEKAKQQRGLEDGEDSARLFFVSSIPWVSFTDLIQPVPEPPDSNVRIIFGKFYTRGEQTLLPTNLTVHHALADGIHMARFFEGFQRRVNRQKCFCIHG